MVIVGTIGRDNVDILTISYDDPDDGSTAYLPFNFVTHGVTKVEVAAGGASISSETSNVVYTGDKLKIKLGKLNLPAGRYQLKITMFSSVSPNGVEIIGPHRPSNIVLVMTAP